MEEGEDEQKRLLKFVCHPLVTVLEKAHKPAAVPCTGSSVPKLPRLKAFSGGCKQSTDLEQTAAKGW